MKQNMFITLLVGLLVLVLASPGLPGKGKEPPMGIARSGDAPNATLSPPERGQPLTSEASEINSRLSVNSKYGGQPGVTSSMSGEAVERQVICTGGALTVTGTRQLVSTIGQSVAGTRGDANHIVQQGFWPDFGSSEPGDVAHVLTTTPSQNALSVTTDGSISVTFDTDMNETTINSTTFVVNAAHTGRHEGSYSYDSPSHTVTFTPSHGFSACEEVCVVLTTGIESTQGYPLANCYGWNFTTQATDGTGLFETGSVLSAGGYSFTPAAADLDGDGDIDLVTANATDDDVSVFLNNGSAEFAPRVDYATDEEPYRVCAADLDGDGDIDLAALTGGSNSISVLLNNGNGTFGGHSAYPLDGYVGIGTIMAADFNGDGNLDLAATIWTPGNVSVLINNGDGTFGPHVGYGTGSGGGSGSGSASVADFDSDGAPDLVVANAHDNTVSVLFNNGDGTFSSQVIYATGEYPYTVCAADLDGDGDMDLATANTDSEDISILLNNGSGIFGAPVQYDAANNSCWSATAADVDHDGDMDIVGSGYLTVFMNDGHAILTIDSVYDGPSGMYGLTAVGADFDGDGGIDVALTSPVSNLLTVALNQSSGCCTGLTGNVDNDSGELIDLGDLTALIDYLFISFTVPVCFEEANVDGDESGLVDLGDLTALIDYLFISFTPPAECL